MMLIEPSEQDKLRAERDRSTAPAKVVVTTDAGCRYLKPDEDTGLFSVATATALADAIPAGYTTVAHVDVTEFILLDPDEEGGLLYRYVWEYTAHKTRHSRAAVLADATPT